MKTHLNVCCTGVLLISWLSHLRHKARLCTAALFLLFIAAAGNASAQSVSNCVTVICPPQFLTNYTCTDVYVAQQYPVIVSNICPGVQVQVNCNPPPGTPFGPGPHPVQCVVTANGQIVGRCDFTIVVVRDTTPPTIRCPSNIVVSTCPSPTGGCGAIVMYPPPVASDNSGDFTVTCTPPSGSMFPCTTTTVTCTVEDRCGLKDTCTFTVTVNPQGQPPSIQCPADITVDTCSNSARVNFSATVTPTGTAVFCNPPSGSLFPIGSNPVTCIASNGCGTAQCSFKVEVRAVPRVTIQCPQEPFFFTVPCGSNCVPVVYPAPVVNNGKLESCNPPSGTCLPVGTHTIVCRATNDCDTVFCVFDVFVGQGQGQPPGITCPSNIVVDTCQPNCQVVNYPPPTVVNGTLVGCSPPPTFCFPIGTTSVTCRATNQCGTNQCTFTITVRPTPPPTIVCPSNRVVTLPCGSNCVPVIYPVPVVNNGVFVGCNPPSGACLPLGNHVVTCFASNNCASASCEFTIQVVPSTAGQPPGIQCPTNIVVTAPCGSNCVPVSFAPIVNNGALESCNPPSGFCFPIGLTTVTCRATNNCGQAVTCQFDVRVVPAQGPLPTIQCPTNPIVRFFVPCGSNCVPVSYSPPPVSNGVLVGCNPPPGFCFPLGDTVVTCVASNNCGSASCEFIVRVFHGDPVPPSIQCPSNIVVNAPCGSNCVPVSYPAPVVNNGVFIGCSPPSGFCFPAGVSTTVICRATNNCGMLAECQFDVRVVGQSLPTIQCPSNIVVTAPCGSNCVPVPYPVPVVNNGVFIGCNPPSGFCFPVGTTPVICRATNNCGIVQCQFDVRVNPSTAGTPPTINCPSNRVVTLPCGSNCVPVSYPLPTVNNGVLIGCNPPPGTCLPAGNHVVQCIASNSCASATCTFTIQVNPGTAANPPTIQCPSNVVVTAPCNSNCVPVFYPLPLVGNGVLAGCTPPRGSCFPIGTTTVTCRATNNCGQSAQCQFTVTVNSGQGQPPVIHCVTSNVIAFLPCGSNCVPVFYPLPSVANGTLVNCTPPRGTCFPAGVHLVTCTATNNCGLSTSCTFNVEVRPSNVQPPVIRCPTNPIVLTIPCGSNCVPISYPMPIVNNGVLIGCNPPPGTCLPAGVYPVTCHASNACARVECEFLIRVIPSEGQPPSIQCPTNPIVNTVPCGSNCVPVKYPLPVVSNGGLVQCTPPLDTCLPVGIYNVTCLATNNCGEARCEFTLEVRPGANAPVINCPTNTLFFQLPCNSNCVPVNYPLPTVSNGVLVDCTPPPGTCLPVGIHPVVCRATNNCGEVRCTFLIRVVPLGDPIPPSIQCPSNIVVTAPCGSNCVPVIYPAPVVNNGTLVGCSPPSGSCFPIGITTVHCKATNGCDMAAECKFDVRVVPGQGQEPFIRCPTNFTVTLPCNSNCVPVNYPLPVVTNGVLIACNPPPGTCLPAGNHLITCFASNDCARASCEFIVTVIRQNAPLTIRCPSNIVVTLPCGSNCVPVSYPPPTVVNGTLVGCNPPPGTCLPAGIYPVVCRATNNCGEEMKCEFQIRVIRGQGQGPVIQCPTNIIVTAPCGSNCVPVFYPPPTVVNGTLESCNPPPGTCFPVGSITTVTCRATNNCGATLCTFTVRVVPPTGGQGPTIQCPTNFVVATVPCGSNCVPVFYPPPTVNNGVLVGCNPPPGTCLPVGDHPVTCVASNNCGTAQCQFTVRVIAGTGHPPILNCPSNITVEVCGTNCQPVTYPLPTVFNGALRGCTPPPGFCFPIGSTPVTCVATNQCGTNTCTFIVTVRPVPYPIIHCPSNIIVTTCGNGEIVNYPPPIVPPGASNLVCTPPSGSFFPVGTHTVRCCVVDRCNRTNCCEFLVIVRPSNPCVKPPRSMVLWLPFDEPVGPIAANIIPGAPNGGHINGPTPLVGQYVLNSLGFDGINDFVRVPNYAAIMLSVSDLTIDAWVRRDTAGAQGRRVIVSKLGQMGATTGAAGVRGYEYYLNNGLMNLYLAGVAVQNFNSGVPVPLDGNWHHVAVTVRRGGGGVVTFYLDGAVVNVQGGPIPLPLANNNSLFVGAGVVPALNGFFRGHIDEVEIFRRALSPAEILALWNAHQAGKCKISCAVPTTVPIRSNGCVTVKARICNNAGVPQTIHWVASGPAVIPPQSGAVTLPPFTCTLVPVTLCAPPTVPPNGQSIWTFSVAGESQCPTVCTGIVVNPGSVGVTLPDAPTGIAGNTTGDVHVGLNGLMADGSVRFMVMGPDMQMDMEHVSLNGLPPGMPWVLNGASKSKSAKADGGDGTFVLPVQFTEADPGGVYTIVIEADLDGDGTFEPLASFDVENIAVSPPTIRIENGQLWWDDMGDGLGTIESADSLEGPWTPFPGGPGTPVDSSGVMKFYRIAVPVPE